MTCAPGPAPFVVLLIAVVLCWSSMTPADWTVGGWIGAIGAVLLAVAFMVAWTAVLVLLAHDGGRAGREQRSRLNAVVASFHLFLARTRAAIRRAH